MEGYGHESNVCAKGTGVFIPLVPQAPANKHTRLPAKSVSFTVAKSSSAHQRPPHAPPTKSKSFAAPGNASGNTPVTSTIHSSGSAALSGSSWATDFPAHCRRSTDPQVARLPTSFTPAAFQRAASSPLPASTWHGCQEATAVAAATTATWCGGLSSPGCWAPEETSTDLDTCCWALDEELYCRTNSSSTVDTLHSAAGSPPRIDRLTLLEVFYGSAAAAAVACPSGSLGAVLPSAVSPASACQSASAPLPSLRAAADEADAALELIDWELERLLTLRQQLQASMDVRGASTSSSRTNDAVAPGLPATHSEPLSLQGNQQQLLVDQALQKLQQLQLMQQLQSNLKAELLQMLPMCT